MAPPRVVLFDLGGVVCRFDPAPRLAAFAALAPAGTLTPADVHARLWQSGFSERCDRGELTAEGMADAIRAALGITAGDAALRAAWVTAFTPDPAVLAIVDQARARVRTGLLTDNPPLLRAALDERYPALLSRFEPALFSYEAGALKPSVEVFRWVVERLGVPAAEVLLIDDAPANVVGARDAGLQALRYRSLDALVADLAELGLAMR